MNRDGARVEKTGELDCTLQITLNHCQLFQVPSKDKTNKYFHSFTRRRLHPSYRQLIAKFIEKPRR